MRQEGAELHDEHRVERLLHDVEDLLHDVVGKLVLGHLRQRRRVLSRPEELHDNGISLIGGPVLNALLNDVRRELVRGEARDVPQEVGYDDGLVRGVPVLEDVLDHVVPVLVLH